MFCICALSTLTLSILETTKGFLTKAILASVFRARNSCISSLLAISGIAHSCWKKKKKNALAVSLGARLGRL